MDPARFKYRYTCKVCGCLCVGGVCEEHAGVVVSDGKVERKEVMSIGFHLGGGTGLLTSAYYARDTGLPCFQSFLNTPRRYWPNEGLKDIADAFKEATAGIDVFFHGPYMINMVANPDTDYRSRRMSLHSVQAQYKMAAVLGAKGIVFHVGSGKGMRQEETDSLLFEFLHEVVADSTVEAAYESSGTKILLENDAGAGTQVASDLWWMTRVLHEFDCHLFGWCLDTAHDYAAGDDWNDPRISHFFETQSIPQYDPASWDDERDHIVYVPDLVHFNTPDQQVTCGSHLDRHSSVLDEGAISVESMKRMYLMFKRLGVPMLSEGSPDHEHDLRISLQWEVERLSGK